MYHAHTLQDTGPEEERILVEPEPTVHAAGAKSGAPPGPRASGNSAALGASSKPAGPPCALAQIMQFNSFNFEIFQYNYHQITLK